MRATRPWDFEVPGDSDTKIMKRSGACMGMNPTLAVWRFGFTPGSDAAKAYHVYINDGMLFVWVLATRKTGKVREVVRGAAIELPAKFRKVLEWEPTTTR